MSKRKKRNITNNVTNANQYNIEIVLIKTKTIKIKIENIFNVVLLEILPWVLVLSPVPLG